MPRQESLQTELKRLLRAHPDTDVMELLIPDVTGVLRSKRIRRRDFDKTLKDGFSLPGGAVLLDTTYLPQEDQVTRIVALARLAMR